MNNSRRQRKRDSAQSQNESVRLNRLERKILKGDARHEWIKNSNMKQTVVTLVDCQLMSYAPIGQSSTYGQTIGLNANGLQWWNGSGSFAQQRPQALILDEYCKMYEYYMVERVQIHYTPVRLDVETTTSGTYDTCTYPTVIARKSDAILTNFSPPISYAGLQGQVSQLACKKGFRVHGASQSLQDTMIVSNTLLLKQDAPMLKTNGSEASMSVYDQDVGTICVLTARAPADRVLIGYVKYEVQYRFAGVYKPGTQQNPMTQRELVQGPVPVSTILQNPQNIVSISDQTVVQDRNRQELLDTVEKALHELKQ